MASLGHLLGVLCCCGLSQVALVHGLFPVTRDERKISIVTALLPPKGASRRGARLRVEAFGGCYTWESQRPDLVNVTEPEPLEPYAEALECLERKALECMDRGAVLQQELFGARPDSTEPEAECQPVAILESVAVDVNETNKVLVFARDRSSPHVELRCEVYLAHVSRIEVETRVRRVNVDDFDTLTARGYDAQGNVFSSLEGLEFEWKVSDPQVLRSPPLVETAFKLSPVRRALAQGGMQSDTLLVHGVATGIASVGVQLKSGAAGGQLLSPDVELTVSEQLFVLPAILRLPPLAHLDMQLKVLRGPSRPLDQIAAVPLPVNHFRWSWQQNAGAGDVVFVRNDSGQIVALREGIGTILVRDTRIHNNTAAAMVQVVEPTHLHVVAVPISNVSKEDIEINKEAAPPPPKVSDWYLVQGQAYMLTLQLRDSQLQEITVPGNLRIEARCAGSPLGGGKGVACPLDFLEQTPGAAVITATARTLGPGWVNYSNASTLADAEDQARGLKTRLWPSLVYQQPFQVVEPLRLLSQFPGPIVLPPRHTYNLRLTGGSGEYLFKLKNMFPDNVCVVSLNGLLQASEFVGSAELVIEDAKSLSNRLELQVIVRYIGGLVLKPPQLQLELPLTVDGAAVPASLVQVFARPEATVADDGASSSWQRLRFWNCSALAEELSGGISGADVMSVESSAPAVAEVAKVASAQQARGANGSSNAQVDGVCSVIVVLPRSPGAFMLEARVRRAGTAAGRGDRLRTEVALQVYAPMSLAFKVADGSRGNTNLDGRPEVLLAPCSTALLVLLDGPARMQVPGRVFQNVSSALDGTHFRLRPAGNYSFEVLCLRPTPRAARLVVEVRHEQEDRDLSTSMVVARAHAWVSCAVPQAIQLVQASTSATSVAMVDAGGSNTTFVSVRRGRVHQFRAHFYDEESRPVAGAAGNVLSWSLRGDTETQGWLQPGADGAATVTVPEQAIPGSQVTLRVEATVPSAEKCAATYGLAEEKLSMLREVLSSIATPMPDEEKLRVSWDLLVRWPGYPEPCFAFVPNWAYPFVATGGSGAASLTVSRASAAEVVHASRICSKAVVADDPGCTQLVHSEVGAPDGVQWAVRPSAPGHTRLTVEDAELLGAAPEILEVSFLPAARVELSLGELDAPAGSIPLLVRGIQHTLHIQVWDTANCTLPAPSWRALRLHIEANTSTLEVTELPDNGTFAILGKRPGFFELRASVYNDLGSVLYSNGLRVHIFEPFSVEPLQAVVLPGQTFEFTVRGGPADLAGAESARVEFSSSLQGVATVGANDGLVVAVAPGRTNITVRLVESETGRELAAVRAEVVVALLESVAIRPLESPVREGRPLPAAALVSCRRRDQSGSDAALPPAASGQPTSERSCRRGRTRLAAYLAAKRMIASDVLRDFTLPLLTAPAGAAELSQGSSHACRFQWSTSSPHVVLTPATVSTNGTGAVAVDVELVDGSDQEESVLVRVQVSCPSVRPMEASFSLPVLQPLQLTAPVPVAKAGSVLLVCIPVGGRVPLAFDRPREDLLMQVLDSSGGISLSEDGGAAELIAGASPGEALVVVKDLRIAGQAAPALLLTVVVRVPHAVRIVAAPRRLPQHAVAECKVEFVSYAGEAMSVPVGTNINHSVAHPSLLEATVRRHSDGGVVLRLHALRSGCTSISVVVESQDGVAPTVVQMLDTVLICISGSALFGQELFLQPGARVNLAAERAAMSPAAGQTLAFSLRLALLPAVQVSLAGIGFQLAQDVAALLSLAPHAVQVAGERWLPPLEVLDGVAMAADFEIHIDVDSVHFSAGLKEIADLLWFPSNPARVGPALQLLNKTHTLREPFTPHTATASCSCCSRCIPVGCDCVTPLRSSSCVEERLTSSDEFIVAVVEDGMSVLAQRSGRATLGLCAGSGMALSTVDVSVQRIASVQVEKPMQHGGLIVTEPGHPDDHSVVVVTNAMGIGDGQLLVPLRFFTGEMQELLSGPFHWQDITFRCEPADAALGDFFAFKAWSLANSTAALGSHISRKLPPLLASGGLQAACVLEPRTVEAMRWAARFSPPVFELRVVVESREVGLISPAPVMTSVQWGFVPQFAVMTAEGHQLISGEVCATLTVLQPQATIWVWSGGHPVEASLPTRVRYLGVFTIISTEPASSATATPSISVTLIWDGPVLSGRVEEIELRLEGRSSGQLEVMRVRVDGREGASGSSMGATPRKSWWPGMALALMCCLCCVFCGPAGGTLITRVLTVAARVGEAPAATPPATGLGLSGPAAGGAEGFGAGFGGSPFRPVARTS